MTRPTVAGLRRVSRGNLAAVLRGNIMNSLLGLVAGLVLARYLDPDGRGLLAIALAWSGISLSFLGLGLRNVTAFYASRHPQRHDEVLRASLELAGLCTVVIFVVGFGGSWLLARDQPELFKALLIAFLATPFALVTGIVRGMINAIDLKLWSRVRLIQPAVYAGCVVAIAFSGHLTVPTGAGAYFLSLLVSAGSVWWVAPTTLAVGGTASYQRLRREMLSYGAKNTLALSAQVTNVRLDVAVLGIFLPASQVGLYAVAASLTQYIVPLSTAAAPWVFPRIARGGNRARSWAEAQRATQITVLLAVAVALVVGASAPLVLGRLLGPAWLGALVPLWILLLGAVMQSVRFTQVSIAGAYNRPALAAYSEGAAALVTVVALWPMVHLFGINGAAIVSVVAYTIGALLLRRGILRAVQQQDQEINDQADSAASGRISVVLVERQPAAGRHFSIERVFDNVADHAPPDLEIRRVRVPASGVDVRTVIRNARAVRGLRADVLHVTGDVHYVLPCLAANAVRVLTVHDLASLSRTGGLRRAVIRKLWYTWPMDRADAVTTVSEETRSQVVAAFRGIEAKVTVVENPVDPLFLCAVPKDPFAPLRDRPLQVLSIGTGANKNLFVTAEAVAAVGGVLQIIGQVDPTGVERLDALGVTWTSRHSISDEELVDAYRSADVLCFPSLSEGFGLPILEAQAIGLPVITSDLSPMREVAAGAAVLVDPTQVGDLVAALVGLREDEHLRHRLSVGGLVNVRRYSPAAVAEDYAALYRRLLEEKREPTARDSIASAAGGGGHVVGE